MFFLSSNFLGDDVMGCISHTNVLSSWMLVFLPYHANWGELLSNALCIFHLCTYGYVSDSQHHLFACWLLSRRPAFTILCMTLLCLSLFPLSQDASPPVVSMDIFNSSIVKFVTSIEFSKSQSSSNLIYLHEFCSLFSVFSMNQMMWTRAILDAVGNTHIILVFS